MFIKGCHCCENCSVCFVNFSGTYQFQFDGECNGNAVSYSGQIVNGYYLSGNVLVTLLCTTAEACGEPAVAGMLIIVEDGNCYWQYVLPGNTDTACPSEQITPEGTYTLKNCVDATDGTLVIS